MKTIWSKDAEPGELLLVCPPPANLTFDYVRQAWVEDGKYIRCEHPTAMNCNCYGRLHEGEEAP